MKSFLVSCFYLKTKVANYWEKRTARAPGLPLDMPSLPDSDSEMEFHGFDNQNVDSDVTEMSGPKAKRVRSTVTQNNTDSNSTATSKTIVTVPTYNTYAVLTSKNDSQDTSAANEIYVNKSMEKTRKNRFPPITAKNADRKEVNSLCDDLQITQLQFKSDLG